MKTDKEFADSVREKAKDYKNKQKKRGKAVLVSAVSFALVVAITLGAMLPSYLNGKGGGTATDYLASFGTTIERQPLYGICGYDESVWDYDNCEWLNQNEYDIVLGDYPNSISAYLAYLLETNKGDNAMHYWVEIECLNYASPAIAELFVATMQKLEVPTGRTVVNYDNGTVSGLVGIWKRTEIMEFAEEYETLCPDNVYSANGVNYLAGITVNVTYVLTEIGSKCMSYYMANSFDTLNDDDMVAVEITQTIELSREELVNFSAEKLTELVSNVNGSLPNGAKNNTVNIIAEYSKYFDMYLNGNTHDIEYVIGTDSLIQTLYDGGCNATVITTDYCSEQYGKNAFYFYVDDIDKAKEIDINLFQDKAQEELWKTIFFSYDFTKTVRSREKLDVYDNAVINGIQGKVGSLSEKVNATDEKQYGYINDVKEVNADSESKMLNVKYVAEVVSVAYMTKAQIKEMLEIAANDDKGSSFFVGYASRQYWNEDCVEYEHSRFSNATLMQFDWR